MQATPVAGSPSTAGVGSPGSSSWTQRNSNNAAQTGSEGLTDLIAQINVANEAAQILASQVQQQQQQLQLQQVASEELKTQHRLEVQQLRSRLEEAQQQVERLGEEKWEVVETM